MRRVLLAAVLLAWLTSCSSLSNLKIELSVEAPPPLDRVVPRIVFQFYLEAVPYEIGIGT